MPYRSAEYLRESIPAYKTPRVTKRQPRRSSKRLRRPVSLADLAAKATAETRAQGGA